MNVIMGENGVPVQKYVYTPGTSPSFGSMVSQLMHEIVLTNGKFTLAELGYLHVNSLAYDQTSRSLHMKVIFDARLAARMQTSSYGGGKKICPIRELEVFQNFLYVGELPEVITYEKLSLPKYTLEKDELDRLSVKFKDNRKFAETQVVVLNCNLALTAAATHNISLMDTEFKVSCQALGAKGAAGVISSGNSMKELPVTLTITSSVPDDEYPGYDPLDAIPYLKSIQSQGAPATGNQEKLQKKLHNKAVKSVKKQGSKGFSKYS